MKKLSFLIIMATLLVFFCMKEVIALEKLGDFSKEDRILILAPHPDDEIIGTAGVIQKALQQGAKVKVVLLTYGENNEFAFIAYEKRIVFKKKEFLRLGEVRRQETLVALASLGVDAKDVISLGYPDYGTLEIFRNHWGEVKPFKSMLSRVRAVPYETAFRPHSSYMAENILRDLTEIIEEYQPTKVFVSHPADTNRDHRAMYLFTKVSLWDLKEKIKKPEVFPYIIHIVRWPLPRGYRPDLRMEIPDQLALSSIEWKNLDLTKEEVNRKRQAITFFPSQLKGASQYLPTFARQNEIFGDYPDILLMKQKKDFVGWRRAMTGDEDLNQKDRGRPEHIHKVEYAWQEDRLLARITLKRPMDKDLGVSLWLLGYRFGVPFAQMPKLHLRFSATGLMLYDKRRKISHQDIEWEYKEKEIFVSIPLSVLNHPSRILTTTRTWQYNLTLDETAWRILSLYE